MFKARQVEIKSRQGVRAYISCVLLIKSRFDDDDDNNNVVSSSADQSFRVLKTLSLGALAGSFPF